PARRGSSWPCLRCCCSCASQPSRRSSASSGTSSNATWPIATCPTAANCAASRRLPTLGRCGKDHFALHRRLWVLYGNSRTQPRLTHARRQERGRKSDPRPPVFISHLCRPLDGRQVERALPEEPRQGSDGPFDRLRS